MATVKVRLFQELRRIAGVGEIELEAISLRAALHELADRYGVGLRDLLFDEHGRLHRHLQVYLNHKPISNPLTASGRLQDGDLLTLISAVGGG